jgi:hypothetical protein
MLLLLHMLMMVITMMMVMMMMLMALMLCIYSDGGTRCCYTRFVISGYRISTLVLVRNSTLC